MNNVNFLKLCYNQLFYLILRKKKPTSFFVLYRLKYEAVISPGPVVLEPPNICSDSRNIRDNYLGQELDANLKLQGDNFFQ